ncbi:MAG: IS110 family transposase [Acidimicrobiia bacterium]|nr:IS110 family transposase [Acidimicrobiia bacterium]
MDVLVDVCAALDVHKDQVTACVRRWARSGRKRHSEVRTFSTMLADLRELRAWLEAEGVTVVGMEATGVYWMPVWYELEDAERFELKLLNPAHVKAVSGRKTDVRDAVWLARLVECEMVDSSFVPPREIRELRDVTRYRRRVLEERGRELQRLQKLLEDAQVKLDSVVSDINGVSARLILEALCDGERDPDVLADLAKRKLRAKIPQLREAVPGRFNTHHALLVRELLAHIDYLTDLESRLDARVDELIAPFSWARDLLVTIPGIKGRNAESIIAEIGVDMSRFPSPAHLASWAGMCPGNNESAGKHRSGKARHGDPWLQSALVEAGWSASRTHNTSMRARFYRIAKRRGYERAVYAVGHHLLVVIWWMLTERVPYREMGDDYQQRPDNPDRRRRHLIRQLEQLGLEVVVQPAA